MDSEILFYIFAIAGFVFELFHPSMPALLPSAPESTYSSAYFQQMPCKWDDRTRMAEWGADARDDDHGIQGVALLWALPRFVPSAAPLFENKALLLSHRPPVVLSPLVSSQGPPLISFDLHPIEEALS